MEYVAPGLVRESSADGLVTVLVVDSGWTTKTYEALDVYIDRLVALRTAHSPCLLVCDLRKVSTPTQCLWLQRCIAKAVDSQPDLVCYAAFIVSQDLKDIALPRKGRFIVNIFLSRQPALAWLLSHVVNEIK